jgi:hypothetical protein
MTSKKPLSLDRIMDVLFSKDSEDTLISEFDSIESSDSEGPAFPKITMISDTSGDETPETLPTYCAPFLPFTVNVVLNAGI